MGLFKKRFAVIGKFLYKYNLKYNLIATKKWIVVGYENR